MFHADRAAAALERQAHLARCCSTWNEDELRVSARGHQRLLAIGAGFATGLLTACVCVLGYAVYCVVTGG